MQVTKENAEIQVQETLRSEIKRLEAERMARYSSDTEAITNDINQQLKIEYEQRQKKKLEVLTQKLEDNFKEKLLQITNKSKIEKNKILNEKVEVLEHNELL